VGAPWSSKRPLTDLVADAARTLEPTDVPRVLVGHGAVDAIVAVDRENPALISLAGAEQALAERRFHYLALGDRHSFSPVGDSGRIYYAGTPEPTDFDEESPGHVLVVTIADDGRPHVEPIAVQTWRFLRLAVELASRADVEVLARTLGGLASKERCVLRLDLQGHLDFEAWMALDACLAESRELFAALDRLDASLMLADDALEYPSQLAGWPAEAARSLAARARREPAARDALLLLHRMTRAAEAS